MNRLKIFIVGAALATGGSALASAQVLQQDVAFHDRDRDRGPGLRLNVPRLLEVDQRQVPLLRGIQGVVGNKERVEPVRAVRERFGDVLLQVDTTAIMDTTATTAGITTSVAGMAGGGGIGTAVSGSAKSSIRSG